MILTARLISFFYYFALFLRQCFCSIRNRESLPAFLSFFFSPQRDPFGTASSLDPYDRAQVENQTVPTLKAFLDLAAQHKSLVIFDLRRPPSGHPYRNTWITRTLEVIHNESFINSSQVTKSLCYTALSKPEMKIRMIRDKEVSHERRTFCSRNKS